MESDEAWELEPGNRVHHLGFSPSSGCSGFSLPLVTPNLPHYRPGKPADILGGLPGLPAPHTHVPPCQHPLLNGAWLHSCHHPQDAVELAQWEEDHFFLWMPPANLLLPLSWGYWMLSSHSYGLWQILSHLSAPPLPYSHDPSTLCQDCCWLLVGRLGWATICSQDLCISTYVKFFRKVNVQGAGRVQMSGIKRMLTTAVLGEPMEALISVFCWLYVCSTFFITKN